MNGRESSPRWHAAVGRRLATAGFAFAIAIAGAANAAEPIAAMSPEDLRALVAAQQQSIDALHVKVDDLSASSKMAESNTEEPSADAVADDVFALSERTSRLEQIVGNTRVGGWLDFLYADSNRRDQDPFFDVHHFYLYFDTRIDEHWQTLVELEFEHTPQLNGGTTNGGIKLDRGYIQYNHSRALGARLGKFRTPWGYWSPVHWAILVDTIQKPIHEDNGYVPNKQVGGQLFGELFDGYLGDTSVALEYAGWVSNGSETIATNEPRDAKLGYGADLRATIAQRVLVGASGYLQNNPDSDGRREVSVIGYTDVQLPLNLVFRSEYMYQSRDEGFPSIWTGYAKLRWDFLENAYLNYRFGLGDDDKQANGERRTQNVVTLGYSPVPNVRFKAEWARIDFRHDAAEDYDFWGIFAGVVF